MVHPPLIGRPSGPCLCQLVSSAVLAFSLETDQKYYFGANLLIIGSSFDTTIALTYKQLFEYVWAASFGCYFNRPRSLFEKTLKLDRKGVNPDCSGSHHFKE